MKIVVLDGFALNPGDLSWGGLEAHGDCAVYDRTPVDEVNDRIRDASIVLTNKAFISREIMAANPDMKYIGVLATGYNVVDLAAASEHGIVVTNVPAYSTPSVAQHVFALLLNLCNHVGLHADAVRAGEWTDSKDFCFWKEPLSELSGKTMGIIGKGQIGTAVAKIAEAFGMHVMSASSRDLSAPELEQLYRRADVVSLHCPLTDVNGGMINRDVIAKMKPEVILINTARGGLIQEHDMAVALREGKLGGFAADVLSTEPPAADNPLLSAPRCVITPHIAWAPIESRARLMKVAEDNVAAFLAGKPVNQVN